MNNSKTSLFLMELIIVILFFSVSAAVCVQMFFRAHQTDEETDRSSHATIVIQNLSECFYESEGELDDITDFYPEVNGFDDGMYIALDESWNSVSEIYDAAYIAVISDPVTDADRASDSESDDSAPLSGYLISSDITVYSVPDETDPDISSISGYDVISSQHLTQYIQYRLGAY